MKALIIQKQWLDMILDGSKTWEMRSRPTKVRGRILLIEAGSGHIVGECVLENSLTRPLIRPELFEHKHRVADISLLKNWCYAWSISNAKRYDKPIPYNHPKGAVVWVNIDEENVTGSNTVIGGGFDWPIKPVMGKRGDETLGDEPIEILIKYVPEPNEWSNLTAYGQNTEKG
jgi:hypothetical protein